MTVESWLSALNLFYNQ